MRTALMLAGVAGATYLLGRRAGDKRKHYSLYQRAALLWTSPGAVRTRRTVKGRTRSAKARLHR